MDGVTVATSFLNDTVYTTPNLYNATPTWTLETIPNSPITSSAPFGVLIIYDGATDLSLVSGVCLGGGSALQVYYTRHSGTWSIVTSFDNTGRAGIIGFDTNVLCEVAWGDNGPEISACSLADSTPAWDTYIPYDHWVNPATEAVFDLYSPSDSLSKFAFIVSNNDYTNPYIADSWWRRKKRAILISNWKFNEIPKGQEGTGLKAIVIYNGDYKQRSSTEGTPLIVDKYNGPTIRPMRINERLIV